MATTVRIRPAVVIGRPAISYPPAVGSRVDRRRMPTGAPARSLMAVIDEACEPREADPWAFMGRWLGVSWVPFAVVATWVAVQRWDQPDAGRKLLLIVLGVVPVVIDDAFGPHVRWFARI